MKTALRFALPLIAGAFILTLSDFTRAAVPPSLSEDTRSILRGVDASIVKELQNAWTLSGAGVDRFEYLILLYQMPDGSISAGSAERSKELRKFKFEWLPGIVAVVHTHPNGDDPRPSAMDERVANRFKVPVFTITRRGMYVYDPSTRRIVEVHQALDWLEPSKWRALEASLDQPN